MSDFKEYDERRRNFKLDDDIEIHGCVYGPPPWLEEKEEDDRAKKEESEMTKICRLSIKKKRKD